MAGLAQIVVEVLVEAGKAAGEVDSLADKFDAMGKKLAGAAAGALGLAALAGFAGKALTAASDLEQAMGGVDAVFKQSAATIHSWAADTSDNIRLPAAEFERLALIIGSQLKNAGVPMDQLAGKTKELIQLGGDLAAAVGGTTADAVEALSSALKGEFDPMERYGVALKAAAINTKALQIAQGDAAKAASRAVQVQATLALITEQTADFHGQAAREADTYAAAQEHLNEVWQNFLAAAGGGALSGAGGILNMLASALQIIQPFVAALSTLVGAFLSLPTPILMAVAAFLAFTALRGPLTTMMSGIGTAFTNFYVSAKQIQAGSVVAGQGMSTMGAMARQAGSSLKSAGGALLGAFGGPIGLAVTVAITAITLGLSKMAESSARAKAMAEQAATAIDSMADALRNVDPNQITAVGREAALTQIKMSQWGKESKDLSDFNDRLGVGLNDVLDAMTGVPGASDKIEAAYQKQRAALEATSTARDLNTGQLTDEAAAADENLRILDEMHSAYVPLIDVQGKAMAQNAEEAAALSGVSEAQAAVAITTDDLVGAYSKLEGALKAAASGSAGQGFLDDMAQAADRASRAASILGAELDKLSGRQTQNEAASVAFQRGLMDIEEAFKGVDSAIDPAALTEWNYEALNSTKSGQQVYDSLTDQTSAYNDTVAAAFASASAQGDFAAGVSAASDAANASRAKFIGMHDAMGLTEEQAGQLANKLGILDGMSLDISILADDAQAQQALKDLQSANIDPKKIMVYADDKATPQVESAISYVDSVTGEVKMIPLNADPTSADQVLQTVLASINGSKPVMPIDGNPAPVNAAAAQAAADAAAQNPTMPIAGNAAPATTAATDAAGQIAGTPATINVGADTANAQAAIGVVADGKRDAIIEVGANTTIAQSAVTALVSEKRTKTIDVTADVSKAQGQITQLAGAKYQATVDVQANVGNAARILFAFITASYSTQVNVLASTGPFMSAMNSLLSQHFVVTIQIKADTSAYMAAYNALPTTKAITQTVTVVQAPQPAPSMAKMSVAGAGGVGTFAAPGVQAQPVNGTSSSTSAGTTIINVNGALDPDSVARQVRNLLRGRERRSGGIEISAGRGYLP